MKTTLTILLSFLSYQAVFFIKPNTSNKLDKILAASHFTITIRYSGCFSSGEYKYEFNNTTKTVEQFAITHYRKNTETKSIRKINLLPNDLITLKTALQKGLTLNKKGACTSIHIYGITDGKHNLTFVDRACEYQDFFNWEQTIQNH